MHGGCVDPAWPMDFFIYVSSLMVVLTGRARTLLAAGGRGARINVRVQCRM